MSVFEFFFDDASGDLTNQMIVIVAIVNKSAFTKPVVALKQRCGGERGDITSFVDWDCEPVTLIVPKEYATLSICVFSGCVVLSCGLCKVLGQ